jgi:hypothetical protein
MAGLDRKGIKLYIDILWFIVLSTFGPRAGVEYQ